MDTNQADIDLIERYLNGKLSSSEVFNFENRLGEDREFARKCRLLKTFPEMMREPGNIEPVKIEVKSNTDKSERKYSNPFKPIYLVWGATAVLIIGISIFFIVTKSNRPVEKPVTLKPVPSTVTQSIPQVKQPDKITEPKRFESTTGKPIELKAPTDGMTFSRKDEILFSWKLETDTFTNFYVFSELNDKLVWWRGIKPGIRENKVAAMNFKPGRFYWYVGTKEVKRTFSVIESNTIH